jgi:predicted dehydrogenase
MNRRLKVAVVGLGVGQEHLRHWRSLPDLFEISLVCDPDDERRKNVTDRLDCRGVADYNDVLAANVDIIDICTPPHLHFEMAKQGLESGHHVVCEKPFVNSLQEVDELIKVQQDANRHLMPISQYRFAGGIQRLKHLVDLGITGTSYISSIETHWNRGSQYYAAPWRGRWDTERGGVILCHALHLHDLLCFVLGDVESVYAQVSTRVNPIETEDCATVSLKMKNGTLVSSSATLGSRQQISRLRFCFENLTAESNLAPYDPGRDPWTFTAKNTKQDYRITEALRLFTPPASGFTGQFMGLYGSICNNEQLPVTLSDARRSMELVTAIYASASTGQAELLPITSNHSGYKDWRPVEAAVNPITSVF